MPVLASESESRGPLSAELRRGSDPTGPRIGAGLLLILAGASVNVSLLEAYVALDGRIERPMRVWLIQAALVVAGLGLMITRRRPRDLTRAPTARALLLGTTALLLASLTTLTLAEGILRFVAGPEIAFTGERQHESLWRRSQRAPAGTEASHVHDTYDPELGWRPEAGHACDRDGGVVTNSLGIRSSREYAFARSAGIRRIVVVGDSYTWGAGVSTEDAYPAALERMLDDTEVINLGVVGWGTDQQYLYLQRLGLKFRPDLVIVGFFEHDYERNGLSFFAYAKPRYEVTQAGLVLTNSPVPTPEEIQKRTLPLPRFLLPAFVTGVVDRFLDHTRLRPLDERPDWRVTKALLDVMRQAARDSGAEFLVMHIPYPSRYPSAVERSLHEWARQTRTHLVRMREAFRGLSDAEFEAVHQPHHWSSRGHQIAAAAIRDAVAEHDQLD
jgi:hypothetical protein